MLLLCEYCDQGTISSRAQERDKRLAYLQKAFDAVAGMLGVAVLAQPAVVLSASSCTEALQAHLSGRCRTEKLVQRGSILLQLHSCMNKLCTSDLHDR